LFHFHVSVTEMMTGLSEKNITQSLEPQPTYTGKLNLYNVSKLSP